MTSETLTTYLSAFKNHTIRIVTAGNAQSMSYQPGEWQLAGDAVVVEIGDEITIHPLEHIERVTLTAPK